MTRKRISREKIIKAIPLSGGMISAICSKSGYTWSAVNEFIKADHELIQMVNDEEARVDDMAENTLIKKIQNNDERVAMWWLARRRKARFGDALDMNVTVDKITIKLVNDD